MILNDGTDTREHRDPMAAFLWSRDYDDLVSIDGTEWYARHGRWILSSDSHGSLDATKYPTVADADAFLVSVDSWMD